MLVRTTASVLMALTLVVSSGCAARTNVQKSALSVGELALGVDQAERDAFAGNLYSAERHQAIGKVVLRLLYAARAYERAVATGSSPAATRADVVSALNDLASASAGVPVILNAVQLVRTALGGA